MNRAFIKESDTPVGSEVPERPISTHRNYVTPSGLAQLRAQLDRAQTRKRALSAAADEIETKVALQAVGRDLRWLQARVGSACQIDPTRQPADRVAFGATVEVAGDDGEHVYRIVGEDEADAEHGLVSYVSPLAKALLGAKVGDEVAWKRPAGDRYIEVQAIRYDSGLPAA